MASIREREGGGEPKEETARKEEGAAEDIKKRKHENFVTKLSPDNKKAHIKEKSGLLREIKKLEEEATRKDLSEVKKKVLKSRLDNHINSKREEIKRMLEEDQKEHERIEANIRSCLDNANK